MVDKHLAADGDAPDGGLDGAAADVGDDVGEGVPAVHYHCDSGMESSVDNLAAAARLVTSGPLARGEGVGGVEGPLVGRDTQRREVGDEGEKGRGCARKRLELKSLKIGRAHV